VPRDVARRKALADRKYRAKKKAEKARKATVKLLIAHLDREQQRTFRALSDEFDLSILYRVALMDLAVLSEAYAGGLLDPADYANKRLKYLEQLRKIAATANDIAAVPVSELTCHMPPLEETEAWFFDPDSGDVVDPADLNPDVEAVAAEEAG